MRTGGLYHMYFNKSAIIVLAGVDTHGKDDGSADEMMGSGDGQRLI